MIRYLIVAIALALILGTYPLWTGLELGSFFIPTLTLIFLSSVGLHFLLLKAKIKMPGYFVQIYLLSLVIKLLAYFGYLLFIILEDRAGAIVNTVFFLIAFFLFTATETWFLVRVVNRLN